MKVAIHDRTHSLGIEVRPYVEKKVMGLADHFDLIAAADVEFERDLKKRREPLYVVKLTLHLLGHRLADVRSHETGQDLRTTFDGALKKLDSEVTQLKERVKAHP